MKSIQESLSFLPPALQGQIIQSSQAQRFPRDTEILREGQYIQVIPIVLEGLIKVFTRYEGRELLLYYIKPQESCVMSFAASRRKEPSQVFAVCEEDTTALLLPGQKVGDWVKDFPDLNALFFQQYNLRYRDLLDTIHHVLFDNMDKRLLDYLQEKVQLTGKNPLKISHRQIAQELGTAREVISRLMKKLEHENQVEQNGQSILVRER